MDTVDASQQSIRLSLKHADHFLHTSRWHPGTVKVSIYSSKMEALETNLWISSRAFCFTLHFYDPLGYKDVQATIMAMGSLGPCSQCCQMKNCLHTGEFNTTTLQTTSPWNGTAHCLFCKIMLNMNQEEQESNQLSYVNLSPNLESSTSSLGG